MCAILGSRIPNCIELGSFSLYESKKNPHKHADKQQVAARCLAQLHRRSVHAIFCCSIGVLNGSSICERICRGIIYAQCRHVFVAPRMILSSSHLVRVCHAYIGLPLTRHLSIAIHFREQCNRNPMPYFYYSCDA